MDHISALSLFLSYPDVIVRYNRELCSAGRNKILLFQNAKQKFIFIVVFLPTGFASCLVLLLLLFACLVPLSKEVYSCIQQVQDGSILCSATLLDLSNLHTHPNTDQILVCFCLTWLTNSTRTQCFINIPSETFWTLVVWFQSDFILFKPPENCPRDK